MEQAKNWALLAEVAALRERAEKAERERDEARAQVAAFEAADREFAAGFDVMTLAGEGSKLLRELAEAREDVRALAVMLRYETGQRPNAATRDVVLAGERIRDRKLLEVSDGE